MNTLQASGICLSFGDRDLLKDAGFTLDSSSRCALVGGNGEGKSTLLKIVSGLMSCDSGTITRTKDLFVSYLPQSDIVLGSETVYNEIEKGFSGMAEVIKMKNSLEEKLEKNPDDAKTLLLVHELQEKLENSDYFRRKTIIGMISRGLGFDESDLNRPCSEFSGGYQMRVALARTLASNPDILLLDEPTNYLDIEARTWLKAFLSTFRGGVMIVCHDRGFLDETVNEIYELCHGKLTRYRGNYSHYEEVRAEEIRRLEEAYRKQKEEIERTEAFIERFRYKATKAKQVQSRVKMLDRIEPVFVPSHLKKLSFTFPETPHSPNDVAVIRNLHKAYGSNVIYDNFDLFINKGDRLAVAGQNGKGKSTLLRMIAQIDRDYGGTIKIGPGVSIGYFAQDHEADLDPEATVLEEIQRCAGTKELPALRNILGNFLFSGDDIYKKTSVLSGGERSRIALLKILLKPVSLLILDEPTNHLDINSQQMLLDAIKRYTGTLVFVSHDSYFISKLATKILYLSDGKPELYTGDYEYFSWKLEQKERQFLPVAEKKAATTAEKAQEIDYKTRNRLKNRRQKIENEAAGILEDTESLKKEIALLDEKISLPENYSDSVKITALLARKSETENKIAELEEKWFSLSEQLEEIDGNLRS